MAEDKNLPRAQVTTPPLNMLAITPSDTVDLTNFTRGVYVGASGNLVVDPAGDEGDATVTFTNLAAGVLHPMIVKRIRSSGTSATGIVAVF